MESIALVKLENLKHNLEYLNKKSSKVDIMPVIKANAYGHGSLQIAKYLSNLNQYIFCVATESEIIELAETNLENDAHILHLGKVSEEFKTFHYKNIIYTINDIDDVDILISKSIKFNTQINCHVKVDTGMNRMGVEYKSYKNILDSVFNSKELCFQSIYSHLSCSDDKESDYNMIQIKRFQKIIDYVNAKKYMCNFHLFNSSGLYNFSNFNFDFVRLGLSIYGICPLNHIDKNLKPVLEFLAPVKLIKNVYKGESIGYGSTFIAEKNMKIGIIQSGYADGIPLNFANSGKVRFKNTYYPIIGRISMDLTCIKIDNNIKLNDFVTIWGGDDDEMKIETISKKFNILPYALITGISQRVKRIYE